MTHIPRAVLDADVIYRRTVYELMGLVSQAARLVDLIWSDELLAEARNTLIEKKSLSPDAADRWVGHLRREFSAGRIDISIPPPGIDLSKLTKDPNDEHVCSLALSGSADYLFSFDKGYRRMAMRRQGVKVERPDGFLVECLEMNPEATATILERQAARWGGGRSVEALLDALERANVERFAKKARKLFVA